MSAIENLAAAQNGTPDPITAAEHLGALLDLPAVGVTIRGARVTGQGSRASVQIALSTRRRAGIRQRPGHDPPAEPRR